MSDVLQVIIYHKWKKPPWKSSLIKWVAANGRLAFTSLIVIFLSALHGTIIMIKLLLSIPINIPRGTLNIWLIWHGKKSQKKGERENFDADHELECKKKREKYRAELELILFF